MTALAHLEEAASWAGRTSAAVALPAIVLLLLGHWRHFAPRWRLALASLLLLRLLLPAVPELSWHPAAEIADPIRSARRVAGGAVAASGSVALAAPAVRTPSAIAPIGNRFTASVLWAAGVIAVGGWVLVSRLLISRRIRSRSRSPDARVVRLFAWARQRSGATATTGLLEVPGLSTPAVWGCFRPVILVPAGLGSTFTDDEIRGMLLHELAHVRRHDVLRTWLGLAACALHWFNPLAWLTLRRLHADRELVCDRMALARLPEHHRRAYGAALLKALLSAPAPAPAVLAPFFRHPSELKRRLLMITRPSSSSPLALLAAILVIPALSLLTLTSARADEERPGAKPPPAESPAAGKPRGETRRDGERRETGGPRDGEARKEGPRDGEGQRKGPRDGEGARNRGPRDGETRKEGEGAPRREGAEIPTEKNPIVLRIDAAGENVAIDGTKVPMGGLRGHLSEFLPRQAGRPVVIEAEDATPHKAVMEVLDAARDNGAKRASIGSARR